MINDFSENSVGKYCHELATKLFPICRSLTGPGVRETLSILTEQLPGLVIHAVPSGTKAFDWTVPDEWTIRDAYIANEDGHKIIDFKGNNLHVVGYSEPVDQILELEDLDAHLHSLPAQPNAIPYVTSYYTKRWGFCLTEKARSNLGPGKYRVVIDADLKPGVMNYAELILPGETKDEVLLSTYMCHPSMANNELSGPVVTTALVQWLMSLPKRKYTYRIVFVPETLGPIVYLSRNLQAMKQNTVAGFVVTCVGDERAYSFLPSRDGDTLADRAARHVLNYLVKDYQSYSWLDRQSDERQYCAPGVDLPVATIMRTKYGEYPEYHTSLDDLNLITPAGLGGGFSALKKAIEVIENDIVLETTVLCEPQLGPRGLYPTLSTKESGKTVVTLMNLISYCDGKHSLLQIADKIGAPAWELKEMAKPLIEQGLLRQID